MESLKKRRRTVVLLLGITAALTTALTATEPAVRQPSRLDRLPLAVDGFIGTDIAVEQSIKDILETPDVLMREYRSPDGMQIALAIVHYQQYRVYFHMPEGCMVGRGSFVVADDREKMPASVSAAPVEANRLVLKKRDGNEYVYYFFVTGNLVTPSYPQMRFHLMTEHLKHRRTGAALVRFSMRTHAQGSDRRLERFKEFIGKFSSILPEYLS